MDAKPEKPTLESAVTGRVGYPPRWHNESGTQESVATAARTIGGDVTFSYFSSSATRNGYREGYYEASGCVDSTRSTKQGHKTATSGYHKGLYEGACHDCYTGWFQDCHDVHENSKCAGKMFTTIAAETTSNTPFHES